MWSLRHCLGAVAITMSAALRSNIAAGKIVDAIEHGELTVPLGERAGGRRPQAGNGRDVHAQLGQGLG